MKKNYTHELIVCIVNSGFSEAVMDAAKELGARGGTVIHGRGTANKEAEKFFGITVQPEKELVLIVVQGEIKESVLHALYKSVGLGTAGQGIAFSLPVDGAVGLFRGESEPKQKAEKAEKAEKPDTEKAE